MDVYWLNSSVCWARGPGFEPRSRHCTISEIGYRLDISRDVAEIILKRRKSLKINLSKQLANLSPRAYFSTSKI